MPWIGLGLKLGSGAAGGGSGPTGDNGILQEDGVSFIIQETVTKSYILQES